MTNAPTDGDGDDGGSSNGNGGGGGGFDGFGGGSALTTRNTIPTDKIVCQHSIQRLFTVRNAK